MCLCFDTDVDVDVDVGGCFLHMFEVTLVDASCLCRRVMLYLTRRQIDA